MFVCINMFANSLIGRIVFGKQVVKWLADVMLSRKSKLMVKSCQYRFREKLAEFHIYEMVGTLDRVLLREKSRL